MQLRPVLEGGSRPIFCSFATIRRYLWAFCCEIFESFSLSRASPRGVFYLTFRRVIGLSSSNIRDSSENDYLAIRLLSRSLASIFLSKFKLIYLRGETFRSAMCIRFINVRALMSWTLILRSWTHTGKRCGCANWKSGRFEKVRESDNQILELSLSNVPWKDVESNSR